MVDRIRLFASRFAIDDCAYAAMSQLYQLVLKVCPDQIETVSGEGIMDRSYAMFKAPLLVQRFRDRAILMPFERSTVSDIVNVRRFKLASISPHFSPLFSAIAPALLYLRDAGPLHPCSRTVAALCGIPGDFHSVRALNSVSTLPAHPPNNVCRYGNHCWEWSRKTPGIPPFTASLRKVVRNAG